jgi:hypothetical protein
MAYVYRHIRVDKNEPFYIGISKRKRRAADISDRNNKIWRRIVAKTDYEVEVLFDDLTWDEAKEKEREFIGLYGRIDLGTGILANMTNGGDGRLVHDNCKFPLFNTWNNIKKVCYTKTNSRYHLYGGKGIEICDKWLNDFREFNHWAISNGWVIGNVISRKNKGEPFDEQNTIILNSKDDLYNTSLKNKKFYYKGECISIRDAVKKYGIPNRLLATRLRLDWTPEEAIETPTIVNKRQKLYLNKKLYNGYNCH